MREEILSYIEGKGLTPFADAGLAAASPVCKTRDARAVHAKVLSALSRHFCFPSTKAILGLFTDRPDTALLKKRQELFRQIPSGLDCGFLKGMREPRQSWKPPYSIVAVTESEAVYMDLRKRGIEAQLISSPQDIAGLSDYELVQAVSCDELSAQLDTLENTVFVNSADDVFLEQYLIALSSWAGNIRILKDSLKALDFLGISKEAGEIMQGFSPLLAMLDSSNMKLTREAAESGLAEINSSVAEALKGLTVKGDALYRLLAKGDYPAEIRDAMDKAISASGIPSAIFKKTIPLEIDYEALSGILKEQDAREFTSFSGRLKSSSKSLKSVPKQLERLSSLLLLADFCSGISLFLSGKKTDFPAESADLSVSGSENIFLDSPQPISFHLDQKERCSILTGANSGGKTTLLEHMIQLAAMFQLGLPVTGRVSMPVFTDIYYFAKGKGAATRGAFEELLSQMSKIRDGEKTLILADEIESVTEPGVAGDIIAATADFYSRKGCFLVIATHLGKEIVKALPEHARIDGIEAKGLDSDFNLIVDHNPVLGRLANSTPELIVERLAQTKKQQYFTYIHTWLLKSKAR